jgi:uncharacterized protein
VLTRRVVRSPHPVLGGLEWPVFEAGDARDGPRVCLLAGVHGCEYSSIAAVRRFMRELDLASVSGSILAVPIVSPTSFAARSPFVAPEDARNLNRSFPGDPDGTFTDVLAHHVFTEFISGSDVLIDLHGGDLVEALEPFTLYDESPVQQQAHEMAVAFGLPYLIRSERSGAIGGTTSASASDAGIPAIIPEAGGCGQMDEASIAMHVAGIENTLRALGVLDGEVSPPPAEMRLVRRFVWLRAPVEGWWDAAVAPGQSVSAGQPLGALRDPFGDPLHEVSAPEDGTIMFVTSSPAVAEDGILLAVGGGIEPL